jgi:hypothetical protein
VNSGYDQPLYVPPLRSSAFLPQEDVSRPGAAQPQADGTARAMTTVSRDGIAV